MIRRPPRSTQGVSSAASDVYKRQDWKGGTEVSAQDQTAEQKTREFVWPDEGTPLDRALGEHLQALLTHSEVIPRVPKDSRGLVCPHGRPLEHRCEDCGRKAYQESWICQHGIGVFLHCDRCRGEPTDPRQWNVQLVLARNLDWDLYLLNDCLLYTSPSPRDQRGSRMPSSA